ncbi:MAG: ABC transporter ATP-binding protein, partial [Candidatus Hodarchaeota archaeon]
MDQTANNIGAQILEIKNLRTYFYTDYGIVKAVDGLNLDLKQGEALGIMGESGSGKTVTALSILRLVARPGRIIEGEILFHGEDLLKKSEEAMRDIRAKKISMVFQDPTSSLNPVYTIGNQLEETVKIHSKNKDPRKTTIEMLKMVEIPTPEEKMRSYPHQLSGGIKKRVFIAIAFLRDPEILIADEATTNLDVTIQAQILLL